MATIRLQKAIRKITDGTTTVEPATELQVVGATVNDLGGDVAELVVTGGGGAGNNIAMGEWRVQLNPGGTPSANGDLFVDAATMSAVTELRIVTTPSTGAVFNPIQDIVEDDYIYLQEAGDPAGGHVAIYTVDSALIQAGGWMLITVKPALTTATGPTSDWPDPTRVSLQLGKGPTVSSGVGPWRWDGTQVVLSTDIPPGRFRTNNIGEDPTGTTAMRFDEADQFGRDFGILLASLDIGDRIYVQDVDNASRFGIYRLTQAPTTPANDILFENLVNEGGGGTWIVGNYLTFQFRKADPNAHASTHEDGGSDEINVGGLSGVLADPQTPAAHAASHQSGGADEINVAGLLGLLGEPQTPLAHAASHQDGGADELDVGGLSGLLGDPQTPLAHGASHVQGGADALVAQLLGSGAEGAGQIMETDGSGGWNLIPTPTGGGGGGPGGIGEWAWAGIGTGTATGPGTFRTSPNGTPATTSVLRFNRFNNDTHDMQAVLLAMVAGDYLYLQQASDASVFGTYLLTEAPTQPGGANTDIIFANLDVEDSGGTWAAAPVSVLPLWAGDELPAHASTHQNGGADEINVGGLSGLLADAQTPLAHASSHNQGGADELLAQNLGAGGIGATQILESDGAGGWTLIATPVPRTPFDGTPAELGVAIPGVSPLYARGDHVHGHGAQGGASLHALAVASGAAGFLSGTDKQKIDDDDAPGDPRPPTAHASTHQTGGGDTLALALLSSGASAEGQILVSDGAGGATWQDPPLTENTLGRWRWGATGSGRFDTSPGAAKATVVSLELNDVDLATGSDRGAWIEAFAVAGSNLYVQRDVDRDDYALYEIASDAVDAGGTWTIAVNTPPLETGGQANFVSGGGNDRGYLISAVSSGGGGTGGDGVATENNGVAFKDPTRTLDAQDFIEFTDEGADVAGVTLVSKQAGTPLPANRILESDGAGGWNVIATPGGGGGGNDVAPAAFGQWWYTSNAAPSLLGPGRFAGDQVAGSDPATWTILAIHGTDDNAQDLSEYIKNLGAGAYIAFQPTQALADAFANYNFREPFVFKVLGPGTLDGSAYVFAIEYIETTGAARSFAGSAGNPFDVVAWPAPASRLETFEQVYEIAFPATVGNIGTGANFMTYNIGYGWSYWDMNRQLAAYGDLDNINVHGPVMAAPGSLAKINLAGIWSLSSGAVGLTVWRIRKTDGSATVTRVQLGSNQFKAVTGGVWDAWELDFASIGGTLDFLEGDTLAIAIGDLVAASNQFNGTIEMQVGYG